MAGHAGFLDVDQRLEAISAKGDPLETINATVPWESFRLTIEVATNTRPEDKKSNAGRPGYDAILKFKMLVLGALYNLSDEALEFQVRDRLSFMRFLGLDLHHPVPDATTIWLFREALVKTGISFKSGYFQPPGLEIGGMARSRNSNDACCSSNNRTCSQLGVEIR
jgi:transposase